MVLAMITAISWGAADFFGGTFPRDVPVFVVVAASQLISLVLLVPVLIVHGTAPPADPRLLLACLAGLAVTVELRLVYTALGRGEAFITAPVGALGATFAVIVGLIGGDRLDATIALGLVFALAGAGLSAWQPRRGRGRTSWARSIAICLGAACGVGTMLSSFHAAGPLDPYWSTAVVTASTAVPATVASLAGRARLPSPRRLPALGVVALAGLVGDLAYAAASGHATLSIVSAISSLYPVSTIALGVITQGQRPRAIQAIGIVLALAGAALLGAASSRP